MRFITCLFLIFSPHLFSEDRKVDIVASDLKITHSGKSVESVESYYVKGNKRVLHGYVIRWNYEAEVLEVDFYFHGKKTVSHFRPIEPTPLDLAPPFAPIVESQNDSEK